MKQFNFNRTELSDVGGWETAYYKSEDINGSWMTQRGCFTAVLSLECGYEDEVLHLVDEYTLEQMLLDNDIYVCFEDQYDE